MVMQIGFSLFTSILFRRFFILFLGCVVLPLTILGGYSYQRVEKQLYEQSMLRLDKDCKVYGMALVDRLVHIKNLTEIFGSYLAAGQSPDEALDIIAASYPQLDDTQLQQLIKQALFVSEVWGRLNAES